MTINVPQREQTLSDLKRVTVGLRTSIQEGALNGADLVLGCRQIIDLWIESGGSSLDDPVIGFTGIESQTSHVLGGPGVRVGRDGDRRRFEAGSKAEHTEVEEIGQFFDESFNRAVKELAEYLADR